MLLSFKQLIALYFGYFQSDLEGLEDVLRFQKEEGGRIIWRIVHHTEKAFSGIALCVGTLMLLGSTVANASDDNKKFTFSMPANSQNVYSTTEYRQTTNPDNKWKVNLVSNTEGAGTKATFWLAKYYNGSHVIASNAHTVKQGSGAHYYVATSIANKSHVLLGCENNNYTAKTYTVSGYWDEETN